MNSSLPSDIQHRIDVQLASGVFSSAEEVLREAFDALERRQRGLLRLRQMIAAAESDIAAGNAGPFDRNAIKHDIRDRLAKQGVTD